MPDDAPMRAPAGQVRPAGITVYSCEGDEAELFRELAPRYGVAATVTSDHPSTEAGPPPPANRSVSVGHKAAVSERELRALHVAGVEHVSTRSIGLDHIDLEAAAELGITVDNVAYAPDGVADFTLMLILLAIRNATGLAWSPAQADPRLGRDRGRDLCDLTVGVVGVGRIGRAVIRRLEGFGCRLLAFGNRPQPVGSAELVPLHDLLAASDVVTLHLPLRPETHHVIGREQIDSMKAGAILVNTARGALVDTDALIAALERGQLGGAALDVLEDDEVAALSATTSGTVGDGRLERLRRLPHVVVTPHAAYHTARMLRETVEGTLTNHVRVAGRPAR